MRRCPRGVIVKAVGCGIVVSELSSPSYFRFRTKKNFVEGMNTNMLLGMG